MHVVISLTIYQTKLNKLAFDSQDTVLVEHLDVGALNDTLYLKHASRDLIESNEKTTKKKYKGKIHSHNTK